MNWKKVINYEDTYEVSDAGEVRSLSRMTKFGSRTKFVIGRNLSIKRRTGKYPFVILSKNNKQTSRMIHRLVAEAFLSNEDNKEQVNHKDGDKNNNCVSNLEWCTRSENMLHALDNGLSNKRKLTIVQIKEIRSSTETDIELGKKYGVRKGNIWNIRNNKSWTHAL